jgi:hypothetical protein
MQVPGHSFTALRSRTRDASASSVARPPFEGRDWRGQAMEETMPLWTISELMHLTRDELCNLAAMIEQSLAEFDAGTVDRLAALTNLGNIRRVMVRRDLHY